MKRVLAALLALYSWVPTSAAAETSFIPLPAISTDPNAGPTYGVLPVILFLGQKDEVKSILAPSVTYNSILGVNATFRYFNYPSALERFEFQAGYTQVIERKFDLYYRNLGLGDGRFHGDARALFDRDATVRFFGLGPESERQNETTMTLQTAGLSTAFGLNLTPTTRLSLRETVQRFDVLRGAIPDLPFTGDRFADLPGVDGATVHAQRLILSYDDRDSQTTPTRGSTVSVFAEASAKALGSGSNYVKGGAEAVHLRPYFGDRMILVARGLVEAISKTSSTPFEVLPTLGGVTTLRGFSENRFYGDARVLLNLETRIRVLKLRLFGFTSHFEVAPFVDAGKVFNNLGQFANEGFEVTPGVGFRGLAPPSVVGHVELGVSREGPAIFVGLDYPF